MSWLYSDGGDVLKSQILLYPFIYTSLRREICFSYFPTKLLYDSLFFLDFLTLENGTAGLSRNVGTELQLNAA
jgi:hypothetical protein